MGDLCWCLVGAWAVPGRPQGVFGLIERATGVFLNPLVAPGTPLWGPRAAHADFLGATLIDRHSIIMVLAVFGIE